jgi:hypothetical protein
MKIRNGFVSNSSSSSFVVILKNGEELKKDNLIDVFGVDRTSPMYGITESIVDWIVDNLEKMSIEAIFDNYCWSDVEITTEEKMVMIVEDTNFDIETLQKINEGVYSYYLGSASDEEYGIETLLCQTDLSINTEDIEIESGRD